MVKILYTCRVLLSNTEATGHEDRENLESVLPTNENALFQ